MVALEPSQPRRGRREMWILAVGFVLTIILYIVLDYLGIEEERPAFAFLKRLSLTGAAACLIWVVRSVVVHFIRRASLPFGESYNLIRITRLVANIFVVYAVVSIQFRTTYALLTGLGVASLVLSFALQAPITSFIAWLYIIFRRPFQVGDRIQIAGYKGDVYEIGYLDTILRECGGDYLGNDRLSGRLIHFPNSLILKEKVLNYHGQEAPFIWNEIAIPIAMGSDLAFVESVLLQVARDDFGRQYPQMMKEEPARWAAEVYFRLNPRAWMEAVLSYPVVPKETTAKRTRMLKEALPLLHAAQDRALLPEGTRR